jgi:phosphatidate cytidylyltransferase
MASRRRPPPAPGKRAVSAERARRRPGEDDLGARVITALPAIAFAVFIVVEGRLWFALGVVLVGVACVGELYTMFAAARPARLAGIVAVVALALVAHYGTAFNLVFVLVAFVPLMFLITMAGPSRDAPTLSMAVTTLGVVWIGLAMAHAVLLRDLPHGDGVVLDVLVGTFLGDTFAYLGGRAFGRRPLAPRISPNKTVEGLVCGVIGSIVGVLIAALYQGAWISGNRALLLGIGVGLAAPIGDLFESAIKRDAGVKDSGRLFGPHGGALDRLDAVLFTIVVGYYVWLAVR